MRGVAENIRAEFDVICNEREVGQKLDELDELERTQPLSVPDANGRRRRLVVRQEGKQMSKKTRLAIKQAHKVALQKQLEQVRLVLSFSRSVKFSFPLKIFSSSSTNS